MTWLKKNLFFTVIMALLAGALGYEIYMILGERSTARAAEDEFQQKVDEYQKLANKSVLPHDKNVQLTQEEIERQRKELSLYTEAIRDQEELQKLFGGHPTSSTNALFDVQFFVEEYRAKAAAATSMTAEDLANEFFGFQAYAQTGPADSLIPTVYKQRLIVAHILDQLFEARPEALVSVSRPGESGAQNNAAAANGGRGPAQQAGSAGFSLNSRLSAAIPDVVKTSPFQVVFTGRAGTLRAFLNGLSSFEMPLLVRSVEVASATESSSSSGAGAEPVRRRRRSRTPEPAQQEEEEKVDENIPLVADNLSRFTVAMEFIDLVPFEKAQ